MRVFVYEHICATGFGRDPASQEHSLFVEGRAMRSAITADFAAVPGVELITFPDNISPTDHADSFSRFAGIADWTLLIAPETGGELERLARMVLDVGGRLLGPSPHAIAITSDKQQLGNIWARNGVPTPRTIDSHESIQYPVVCKPRDGCGSEGVRLIRTAEEWAALPRDPNRMVQELVSGRAVSVAFLVGHDQFVPLRPTFQLLSVDGRFRYLGGMLPIMPDFAERAVRLVRQAIGCVPGLFGYVGVDLVLGERDVAIEINPRLTTSYVGLRAAAETNLSGAMLDVCEGRNVEVRWKAGAVKFAADRRIE